MAPITRNTNIVRTESLTCVLSSATVAGFGMTATEDTCKVDTTGKSCSEAGCKAGGNFGIPIFDTTDGRLRVYFFATSTNDELKTVLACVSGNGWRKCVAEHATVWLDTPIIN